MRTRYVALALVAFVGGRLNAQYGPVQDSTLIGLRRIVLNVSSTLERPNFREGIALELRKAGIRVAADSTPPDSLTDGVMNVLIRKRDRSSHCVVRIDLEQRARLVRTARTHRMVTWFYEEELETVCRDSWFEGAVKRAVDAFLTKWLDMNGR